MNKSINAYKKFQFFEPEKPNEDPSNKLMPSVKYTLDSMTPIEMRVNNKLHFVNGQKKDDPKDNLFRIVKVQTNGKVIDEYIPFSDTVIDFDLKDVDGKTYLVAVGTDLKDPEKDKREATAALIQNDNIKGMFTVKVTPTPNSIPSIKIFDFTKCIEKTNCEINNWKE